MNTSNIRKKLKVFAPGPIYNFIYGAYKGLDRLYGDVVNRREIKKCNFQSTKYGLNTEKRNFDITVSFTTFPARIEQVKYVADVMLRQTLKPDRLMLVLAESEFHSIDDLPNEYENLQKRGLSIVFMENLKPHKKYYYALKNYPNSILITIDDDIFYDENLLKDLYSSYVKYPNSVSAMRVHRMIVKNGKLLPYNDWELSYTKADTPFGWLFATGIGGILYPPHSLHREVLNKDLIKELALNADDVWLKTMQVLNGTKVVLARPRRNQRIVSVGNSYKSALSKDNVDNGRNDLYIKNCLNYFSLSVDEFADKKDWDKEL